MKTIFEVDENNKRFASYDGYKFDRYIFRSIILVLLLFAGLTVFVNEGLSPSAFVTCPVGSADCYNPFYTGGLREPVFEDLFGESRITDCIAYKCEREFLFAGESAGVKPHWIIRWSGFLTGWIVIFGFLYNHHKYNKGFFKGRKIDWKDFDLGKK
jgi:hypothetical protein